MKKTLVACLAVAALFAMVGSANAITCTIDQRPAATLLVPYFQATFNDNGTPKGEGADALDTLVTIVNASSAPMLAHVDVWNERSEIVLDFDVALTGFDVQSWSMASILAGFLPRTGYEDSSGLHDACERNPAADVFLDPASSGNGEFLRTRPGAPTSAADVSLATTLYQPGPFSHGFLFQVLDSLDATADSFQCGGVDGVIVNPIHGYVTIDHVNYCNLSNPSDANYYVNDAIGMENNLFGDIIYTSGSGIGTAGMAAVAIEADPSLADATAAPITLTGAPGRRTFYRRYVTTADPAGCNALNIFFVGTTDCGGGDQREPLGLTYAARWFDSAPVVTSFFNVWRASSVPSSVSGGRADLLGYPVGDCNTDETSVTLNFYDEDENPTTGGDGCPSPCTSPTQNFPLETQRVGIAGYSHPTATAGWVQAAFFNNAGPVGGVLDQAWVSYDFLGASAFLEALVPGTQLDPTNCQPLGVANVTVSTPVIPTLVGWGP